ncbi:MAG: hypothetical protein JW863_07685 [Chitinispirillaceae bacterium]|nr:hypothetical protein [Chitinispirillaceae bacterium]
MPKQLNGSKKERGSALVGILAFTVVMAIAGSGLMMLSGNAVTHEDTAYRNDLAFLAAESGLQIGTRWLADQANYNDYVVNNPRNTGIYEGIINDDTVRVSLEIDNGEAKVVSQATNRRIEYIKEVSWYAQRIAAPNPGIFINNMNPTQGAAQGGINNTWFEGTFHSNTPIYISSVGDVRFVNGDVTVSNHLDYDNFELDYSGDEVVNVGGDYGHYGTGSDGTGNNYDFGVFVTSGTPKQGSEDPEEDPEKHAAGRLDQLFQKSFTHSQPELTMPRLEGEQELLPTSIGTPGLLRFYVYGDPVTGQSSGRAIYYYHDGTQNRTYDFAINNKVIRADQCELDVLGTVMGQATVVTDPGYNIYPVGSLVYEDFVETAEQEYEDYDPVNNYGVNHKESDPDNVLALFSGADIHFREGEMKVWKDGSLQGIAADRSDVAHLPKMYITASLYAIEPDKGLMWDVKENDGHWLESYDYRIRGIGSRTLDKYFNYESGGGDSNEMVRFYFDNRILDDLRAPGVPEFQTVSDGSPLVLLRTRWVERNIAFD